MKLRTWLTIVLAATLLACGGCGFEIMDCRGVGSKATRKTTKKVVPPAPWNELSALDVPDGVQFEEISSGFNWTGSLLLEYEIRVEEAVPPGAYEFRVVRWVEGEEKFRVLFLLDVGEPTPDEPEAVLHAIQRVPPWEETVVTVQIR